MTDIKRDICNTSKPTLGDSYYTKQQVINIINTNNAKFYTKEQIAALLEGLDKIKFYETTWQEGSSQVFTIPKTFRTIFKVYVNGNSIQEFVDYTIDIETNTVTILNELDDEDFIRIEYFITLIPDEDGTFDSYFDETFDQTFELII